MAIANKEQSTRPAHRQVNRDAFNNSVEVHVATEAARIAGGDRTASRGRGDAPQHGTKRHREALQVITGLLSSCNHALVIEMPAHTVAGILEFHGHVTINSPINDAVVADRIVAIQTNARKVNSKDVVGPGSFNI